MLWTPVDLGPRAPARGYSGLGRIPLHTLTSGIKAHGQKNLENLTGHMVTGHYYTCTFHSHVVTTSQSNFGLGSKLSTVMAIAFTVGI
jgi:hypothetical protein